MTGLIKQLLESAFAVNKTGQQKILFGPRNNFSNKKNQISTLKTTVFRKRFFYPKQQNKTTLTCQYKR